METKTIKIPKGYEIDKEKSNESKIVLNKIDQKPKTWKDYCKMMEGKDSYFCHDIVPKLSKFEPTPAVSEFADKEDAEAFAALSKLIKLRKAWIGSWKPDYMIRQVKFSIYVCNNKLRAATCFSTNCSMSFPTEKMRNEFFNCFEDLLEQAKRFL